MGIADAAAPGEDLSATALGGVLGDRPLRAYPALLSTEADALAWARAGAPSGAVVVADYQVSPRGRSGRPWEVRAGEGLGFSIVVRPELPALREGWLYVAASAALADVLGTGGALTWPDEAWAADARVGAVGVHAELGAAAVEWAVVTVLADRATPPRGALLAGLLRAIEARLASPDEAVLTDYRSRCATLGRRVRARMIPMSPDGPQVVGEAVDVRTDGGLVLATDRGSRVVVLPQHLGVLEDPATPGAAPPEPGSRLSG